MIEIALAQGAQNSSRRASMSTIQRFAASLEAASAEISRPTFSTLGPPAAYDAAALTQALRSAARHMRGAFEGQEKPGKEPKPLARPRVAVVLPCHNEAAAIARVVGEFRAALPHARIIVFDNASTDATAAIAAEAGAEVHYEPRPGKGNVVRRMFADVEADVFVLVDGDDTYDAGAAPELVDLLLKNTLDMVNGTRQSTIEAAYRRGHVLGNRLLTGLVATFFGNRISDLLSGYRVFSRRFVKSFPALTTGFEIETELSVHALQLRMPIGEVNTDYRERPAGSASKLSTYKDGFRILRTIAVLVKEEKPLAFFSVVSLILVLIALALGVPVIVEFTHTGLVPRFPTAILAAAIVILSFLSFACGLILDTVSRGRAETRRLAYLSFPVRFSAVKPREFVQSRR
jgi:glycosyltransferase involved in cell wall biosynthesis